MRIVHYYPRALVGDGGPTIAMWGWARALLDLGLEVAIVYDAALTAESQLADRRADLLPLRHVGRGRSRRPVDLGSHLRARDVVVLHSAYVTHNVVAARAARKRAVPYIVVPHGGYNRQSRGRRGVVKSLWQTLETPYLERALAVQVFFPSEVPDVREVAPSAQTVVAPNGIDVPEQEWDGGSGDYVVWLGRYDIRHKGLDILLEAMSLLPPAERPRLRLHGKDSANTRADVHALTERFRVGEHVDVEGPVYGERKVEVLRRALGYAHPSRWESNSLALLENLALGLPCVVSDSIEMAGMLAEHQAAISVHPNPANLALGLRRLTSPEPEIGYAARRLVSEQFSWPTVARAFLRELGTLGALG